MKQLLAILMLWIVFAPFSGALDQAVTSYFYQGAGHFTQFPFYLDLYKYGLIPSQVTGVLCTGIIVWSLFGTGRQRYRKAAALVLMTLLVGCILIVNMTFKDHWGRPRPKQVEEYGGRQPFRPFYSPHVFKQPEPSRSFPCGHCSAGFVFFSVAFAGSRLGIKWLEYSGYILAMGLGIGLSLARIAMGGHFLTDTLASVTIMWLIACFFDWYFFARKEDACKA